MVWTVVKWNVGRRIDDHVAGIVVVWNIGRRNVFGVLRSYHCAKRRSVSSILCHPKQRYDRSAEDPNHALWFSCCLVAISSVFKQWDEHGCWFLFGLNGRCRGRIDFLSLFQPYSNAVVSSLFGPHFTPNLKRRFGFSFCIKSIYQGCCSVRKSVGKNTMNLCKEPWIEKFWRKRDEKTTNRDDVLGVVCLINRVIGMTNYDTCKYFNHHNLLIRNLQFTFNWQKIKENGDAEQ